MMTILKKKITALPETTDHATEAACVIENHGAELLFSR